MRIKSRDDFFWCLRITLQLFCAFKCHYRLKREELQWIISKEYWEKYFWFHSFESRTDKRDRNERLTVHKIIQGQKRFCCPLVLLSDHWFVFFITCFAKDRNLRFGKDVIDFRDWRVFLLAILLRFWSIRFIARTNYRFFCCNWCYDLITMFSGMFPPRSVWFIFERRMLLFFFFCCAESVIYFHWSCFSLIFFCSFHLFLTV